MNSATKHVAGSGANEASIVGRVAVAVGGAVVVVEAEDGTAVGESNRAIVAVVAAAVVGVAVVVGVVVVM